MVEEGRKTDVSCAERVSHQDEAMSVRRLSVPSRAGSSCRGFRDALMDVIERFFLGE